MDKIKIIGLTCGSKSDNHKIKKDGDELVFGAYFSGENKLSMNVTGISREAYKKLVVGADYELDFKTVQATLDQKEAER